MATSSEYGAFLNTTQVWDVSNVYAVENISPQLKELLVRMYQNLNIMAQVINVKTTGQFPLMETVDSNTWFPNPLNNSSTAAAPEERQEMQKTFYLTSLATFNHGITVTPNTTFTAFRGMANDTVGNNYYPLPWPSAAGLTNIEIKVNATQVVITNNSGITFNKSYLVLYYLQS